MNIRTELYELAQRAAEALPLPALASALITDPQPAPDRNTEFGLLALADGCAGLYYAWLGDSQADMPARFKLDELLGRPALELAHYVLGDDDGTRSLGIAAINAITEHVYRKATFAPAAATDWPATDHPVRPTPRRSGPTPSNRTAHQRQRRIRQSLIR